MDSACGELRFLDPNDADRLIGFTFRPQISTVTPYIFIILQQRCYADEIIYDGDVRRTSSPQTEQQVGEFRCWNIHVFIKTAQLVHPRRAY